MTMQRLALGLAVILMLTRGLRGEDAVIEKLLKDGVSIGGGEVARLPAPILRDDMSAAEQRQAIEGLLAGKYTWEAFSRNSVVAPFFLKITDNETVGTKGIGRRVDVAFVAYGDLQKIQSDEFLNARFQGNTVSDGEQGDRVNLLTADELQARHLPAPRTSADPRWVAMEMILFEKVRISTTTRNEKYIDEDSVLVASWLDPQFNADRSYPNAWRSLQRDEKGQKQLGPQETYAGLGSYVKATKLREPAGGLFVEYHVAFAEPAGWFQGANLLRSKLPIAVQDSVRRFRRSLAEK